MLTLSHIGYQIGDRVLFAGVDLNINSEDRYGLVGANGTGKTTLLRIITGEIMPTQGHTRKLRKINIGYLPQEEIVLRGNTLIDEVLRDYNFHLAELSKSRKMLSDDPHSKKLLSAYEQTEDNFHKIGGYHYEVEAQKVLYGLGFTSDDRTKQVQEFSSGWQMRMVLARILLSKPDLLLLDEPTNHLDIESIQWLENYLENFKGAIVVVSHDRYFLDKILKTNNGVSGIWEIDLGQFRKYRTNYSGYLQESQIRKQRLMHLAKEQDKKISEIKEFIARNRANKSKARIVKSREKYLERLERIQVESERDKIKVSFPVEPIHGRRLIHLKGLSKAYDQKMVFKDINLTIENKDKIALIGKNGAGKSTLCRIIAGHEKPTHGERQASERLKIAAFSHEILLALQPSNTVLEEVARSATDEVHESIRRFLGLFLFSGDDVLKKISVLSGGEKTRLVILKAMIETSNLLILDEPTYHLDKDSVEAIKHAVNAYEGTIILVTHDRDLIASFANRIFELKDGRLNDYPGDFSYYLWKRNQTPRAAKEIKKAPVKESPAERLKREILQKETRRNELRVKLSRPHLIKDPRKSKKLFEEYQRLTEEIEKLEEALAQT